MVKPKAVYPPPDQILSALGIEVAWRGGDTMIARALVDVGLLGRGGAPAGMGALAPLVDLVAGARITRASEGDWLATSDMWMHERAPLGDGPLRFETRLLRAGKRSAVAAVEVFGGDRVTASCTVEFSRIRREASPHVTSFGGDDGAWLRVGSGDLLSRPIEDACDLRPLDAIAGTVDVHRSPFVANSIGTLQGGVVVLLADAAAAAVVGPMARTVDMQYRFLAKTGDGPARATAEIVRSEGAGATVKVEVVDRSDGTLVGWAICRVVSLD